MNSHPTTPEHRRKVLEAVARIWEGRPGGEHLRLGQLLSAVCPRGVDVFYLDDVGVVRAAEELSDGRP